VHPMTRFNSVVSPHRIFETRRFMVEEFEEIAALADVRDKPVMIRLVEEHEEYTA